MLNQQKKPLWTRDFTIITLGSVVSMLGNNLSGFAMSLKVLDIKESTPYYALYYAVFIFFYTLPRLIMPIVSGTFLDRFSRKKTIYTLDFISSGLYLLLGWLIYMEYFNFVLLVIGCFIIGSIDSIYNVAYTSFYPLLISEGNYSKAYSVASTLETIAALMIPVAVAVYNTVGIVPLLIFNSITFFIAAVMETKIGAEEKYINEWDNDEKADNMEAVKDVSYKEVGKPSNAGRKHFWQDTKEGLSYLMSEKGLLAIAIYFTFSSFAGGASQVITLPYFKSTYPDGEFKYLIVWGMAMVGRLIGGNVHYFAKLPVKKKYTIALMVYIVTSLIEGTYLYFPVKMMMGMCFIIGVLGVTSYNIRVSATQNYVPDIKKGRFNGIFSMLNTSGMLLGEVLAGALTTVLPVRMVLSIFMGICALSAVVVIGGNKKHVSAIYNIQA